MENTLPIQPSINAIPEEPSRKNNPFLLLGAGGIILAIITGLTGYYLGRQGSLSVMRNDVSRATPAPTVSPIKKAVKVFSSPDFPGEFTLSEKMYTAGTKVEAGNSQIFISSNPIIIPETWDSPFVPLEVRVVSQSTADDNYEKQVELIKSLYTPDSLVTKQVSAGARNGLLISGTIAEGYGSGEKISQAIFNTQKGYINFHYYPFVDQNFSNEQFLEVVNSLSLK